MRAAVIPCLLLAAMWANECKAVDWEINLESNINPNLAGLDQSGYRWDLYRDRSRISLGDSHDLLKAEAVFRPNKVGAVDWEIGVGATVRPSNRTNGYDRLKERSGLGDFDGSFTVRATIRPGSSRSMR